GEIVADATHLYWSARGGLRRMPLAGGAVEKLGSEGGAQLHLDGDQLVAVGFDVHYFSKSGVEQRSVESPQRTFRSGAGQLFHLDESDFSLWTRDGDSSVRVADDVVGPFEIRGKRLIYGSRGAVVESGLTYGTAHPLTKASGLVTALHLGDQHVLFADAEGVKRAPRSGGAAVLLRKGSFSAVTAGPDGTIYAGGLDGVFAIESRGVRLLDRGFSPPLRIRAGAEWVYYTTDLTLRRVPTSAHRPETPPVGCGALGAAVSQAAPVASRSEVVVEGLPSIFSMAVDESHAYVGFRGGVLQVSRGDGQQRTLTRDIALGVATTGDDVFWLTPATAGMGPGVGPGGVYRLSKSAAGAVAQRIGDCNSSNSMRAVATGGYLYAQNNVDGLRTVLYRWNARTGSGTHFGSSAQRSQFGSTDTDVVWATESGEIMRSSATKGVIRPVAASGSARGMLVEADGTILWSDGVGALWRKTPASPASRWFTLGSLRPTLLAGGGGAEIWIVTETGEGKGTTSALLRLEPEQRCPSVVVRLDEPVRDLAVSGDSLFLLSGDQLLRLPRR
ncbi:MAG: hypothetical protein JRI68_18510, partial [Deltaproteobacteria bacterium]|nr:hypothetical protein [Deltaproteobacteria bacterium]